MVALKIWLQFQYQNTKDGRLWRSIQKGTVSFAKTTGYEILNLGVKLASGTQVLLEQGEEMLGGEGSSVRSPNLGGLDNRRNSMLQMSYLLKLQNPNPKIIYLLVHKF